MTVTHSPTARATAEAVWSGPAGAGGGERSARERRWAAAEELLAGVEGLDPEDRERCRGQAVVLALDLPDLVARRYRNRGIEEEDLVQVGRMALVKAVRGYRPGRGHSFAAFAVPTIAGEVKRHFRDQGWAVRPPRRLQERRAELLGAQEELRHELQHEPSRVELAERLGWAVDEVTEAIGCCAAYNAQSLDAPSPGAVVVDRVLVEANHAERLALHAALGHAIGDLSARECTIVRLRFVEEKTQSEIGALLGISQMQVSRLLTSILRRLRLSIEAPAA